MIISMNIEKAFSKIQNLVPINTFSELGIEGNILNLINDIHEKPVANIILSV